MYIYKVMVSLKARSWYDDPISGEYSGISHRTRSEAILEMEEAKKHDDVDNAYISMQVIDFKNFMEGIRNGRIED